MVELHGYIDREGNRPFARWFEELDSDAAARVTTFLTRIGKEKFSRVKGVEAGVFEGRIDFGPGYRVYFGKHGDRLVILVGGGTKVRQSKDVADAHARWADYKRRKKQERD